MNLKPFFLVIWIFLGLVFVWLTKEITLPVFLGTILGITLQNLANFFKIKFKLNFYLTLFLLYLFVVTFLFFLFYSLFRVITTELPNFIQHLNDLLSEFNLRLEKINYPKLDFVELSRSYFPNFLLFLYSLFGNFLSIILVFVVSIYISFHRDLEQKIFSYFEPSLREEIFNVWFRIKRKLSFWLLGQLILMLSIGLATYIVYALIFKLPYSLLVSVLSGVLEALPILGPIFTTMVAVFIVMIEKPDLIFPLILSFFLIQQLENHFLVPIVMRNTVKLNPILVLLGIFIAGKFFGFWGVLSVLPMLVIITEIFNFYFKPKN